MSARILISLEGRLKSNPSFTSLIQNNLFRETIFSLLQLVRKQENRDFRMESPFQQVVCTIVISLGSTRCWNPFSLHSIAVFIDRSNILVRSFTHLYVSIVLADYTVLMLQEDS
jgi:hypothetical protein